jgi:hypothetical protein
MHSEVQELFSINRRRLDNARCLFNNMGFSGTGFSPCADGLWKSDAGARIAAKPDNQTHSSAFNATKPYGSRRFSQGSEFERIVHVWRCSDGF